MENLTTEQAAAFLNLTKATLNQWRWLQTGPPYARYGRSIRYRRSDLVEYVAAHIIGGSSDVVVR